jgi:hypothetical protein
VSRSKEVQDFAVYLRTLKDQADRTYGALAKRTGMSSSALHRYCNGEGVPLDFAPVERLGRACGASREELRELQRRWVLADAVRNRAPGLAEPVAEPVPGPVPEPVPGPVAAQTVDSAAGAPPATPTSPTTPTTPATPTGPAPPAASGRRRLAVLVAGVLAVMAAVGALVASKLPDRQMARLTSVSGQPMLLSPACPVVLSMGEQDECVRELQRLLQGAGTAIEVDAQFGPHTRRRVTAFQVLAGLPPNGIVDERTKRALYDGKVRMTSWPKAKVEKRIREVFPEAPHQAVAIARCQSFLDPLWVLSNEDGSRNWGLFQIWDRRVEEMGGTPLRAFDPEWNIQAARRLWAQHRDFRDWSACSAALTTRAPTPTTGRSPG